MPKKYDERFERTYAGHVLCSLCGHEMAAHDTEIDYSGITHIVCHCTEACFCGKGPSMPYGYFEVKRKSTIAYHAEIVLGRNADGTKWVTMRYNSDLGRFISMHIYINGNMKQEELANNAFDKRDY